MVSSAHNKVILLVTFIYLGESKILQYFNNVRYNLAVPDAFAEVVKVMNHTGL